MKKLFCILLCVMLLISSAVSFGAVTCDESSLGATSGSCGDNLTWSYDEPSKTLTISGTGAMYSYEDDDTPWESNDFSIKRVVVEEGVTTIGDYAFCDYMGISEISLPSTLVSIGDSAFYCCESLADIVIPDGVTIIGSQAFGYCWNLESITLPASVLVVERCAFAECENLTEIFVLNKNCDIYDHNETFYKNATIYSAEGSTAQAYAQQYNRNFVAIEIATEDPSGSCGDDLQWSYNEDTKTLTISGSGDMTDYDYNTYVAPWCVYPIENVVIEQGVTSIGSSAFNELSTLTSVSIADGVTCIGANAFRECDNLKSIELPSSVTTLCEYAFSGCRALESFTIPQGVTTLPECVLGACVSLKEINIPSGVTDIDILAFNGCLTIERLTVDEENTVFDSRNNCNAIIDTAADTLVLGCKSTVIDNTVTSIGERAFHMDHGPIDITIPGNVKSIGDSAFSNLISTTNVTIEEGVETIGAYAFSMTQNIKALTLPKSVKYIGNGAFGMSSIEKLTILNPGCEIYDHSYTLPNLAFITICGFEDSTAQLYAEKYNRKFEIYVPTEFEVGDVDLDGTLSILDATLTQRYLAMLDSLTDKQMTLADVDGDGKVSVIDATKIQRILAKLE